MTYKTGFIIIAVAFLFSLGAIVMLMGENADLKAKNEALIAANSASAEKMSLVKKTAYVDGLIKCGNEDVTFLNEEAEAWASQNTEIGKLMSEYISGWAQTWNYDEDTIRDMVLDYMEGETE